VTFEIQLLRLGLAESGRLERDTRGNNLLTATLLYPSAAKATVTTVKGFKLRDDQVIDLTGKNPATDSPFSYGDRVLFKEEIQGECELVLEVTDVEQPSTLDKVITGIIGAVFKGAWAIVTGGISNIVLGAVVGAASGAHLSSLSSEGDQVRVLGRASVPLHADMQDDQREVPLVVPGDVELTQVVLKPGGSSGYDLKKTVLKRGSINGRVVLRIRRLATD
jgi:hypothetical protein